MLTNRLHVQDQKFYRATYEGCANLRNAGKSHGRQLTFSLAQSELGFLWFMIWNVSLVKDSQRMLVVSGQTSSFLVHTRVVTTKFFLVRIHHFFLFENPYYFAYQSGSGFSQRNADLVKLASLNTITLILLMPIKLKRRW